jgi:heavy metal sensor kinase
MARSIRWRLQGWYAVVLAAVVTGLAGLLYDQVRVARFLEIDAALVAAAQYLDVSLRRLPAQALDRRGPPSAGAARPRRDPLLDDLSLPRRAGLDGDGGAAPFYFAIWQADGSLLKATWPQSELTAPTFVTTAATDPCVSQRDEFREAYLLGPGRTRILVGRSVQKELTALHALAWKLGVAGAAVLAVGLVGGWLVSGRILRPVGAITAAASAMSAANLSERIDPEAVDRELQDLAGVLNATFSRLEAAFERQARFTADASHELRTPLAIIRSHAQLALDRPRSADEYRRAVEACLHASERMTVLVEGLLTLARADAGRLDLRRQPVDLRRLTAETLTLFRPLAAERRVSLDARLEPANVVGDPDRLAQVVINLLSNAVRYNRLGGSVRVGLGRWDNAAILTVADSGVGIPEPDQPHVFERFYRVDKARSRASGGTGLGLPICRSIVTAHGGVIAFTSALGRGTTFEVRLPLGTSG